jgi:hypothetical protein
MIGWLKEMLLINLLLLVLKERRPPAEVAA